jgi:uncharacterized protein YjbI with pentapeptide repeats
MRFLLLALCLLPPALSIAANQRDLEKLMALQKTTQTIQLDLSNADLRKYPFIPGKIDLQQANISHSNLAGVDLSKMNLSGADLSYTDLSNTKLNQVSLVGANLDHANLTGAEIIQSDLSRANLHCANLNQANLSKSIFNEANISGASLINTTTTDAVGYTSVSDVDTNCES